MATGRAEPLGTLATALAQARRLLAADPARAVEQADEILKVVPNQPDALLLLGTAYGAMGRGGDAIDAIRRAIRLNPHLPGAWRALGDQLTLAGDTAGADDAYARHIKSSVKDPQLLAAASALCDNRLAVAERLLREFLKVHPTDVAAIRMLAETGSRLGRYEDAENLLARCVELAPGFEAARHNYAVVLNRRNKPAEALAQVDALLGKDPRNPGYRGLKAAALSRLGDYAPATAIYEKLLKDFPDHPKAWMSYGHTLKSVGRLEEGVAAYRRSIAQLPSLGEAHWSLANLKTFRFAPEEIDAMRAQLAKPDLADEDRYHFHFALGKALEDTGEFAASFEHYENGNTLRRAESRYDAEEIAQHVRRSKTVFTREFFDARSGFGFESAAPIFIVGLPRAGSTLLEQILSSHSQVEGTTELPDIIAIAKRLGGKRRMGSASAYPESLNALTAADFRALGEEFIVGTRVQRKLDRPFFIDKMPNNFLHVGLVHLILPKAKIIDARRHPLGCCFSCFKQHFARGQNFTYSLADIGRYYADYVELMAHFDAVLPRRVHRVLYEDVVDNPEREIRHLLDYCGLSFEEGCLRFYENDRAVRTASSEQVRQPIFRDAVEHWQNFDPWLAPLREALGPVLEAYPAVPPF